ncbi:MAG: HlyD family efflux transporter periplasmic adaptor subunit [Gemmatimonadota bacterium]|nr:HlyD family efflux transporter periplasmic adaptor subunit [Gemmatimonadota bacterium]
MMRRRRRHRVLKWMLWVGGVLAAVILTLSLIEIDDVVIAQGIVEPGTKIYIDSPLKRVIEAVHIEAGQPVKAGQPVVQLYNGDLLSAAEAAGKEVQRGEANLEHARANLALLKEKPTAEALKIAESRVEQARIALKARKQELKRAETLYFGERLWSLEELERARTNQQLAESNLKVATEEHNLTRRGASPAELRQATAEVRQARAALAKARSSLEGAREGLELTTMRSPVSGIVARQDLHPGMLAEQGQIVLIIAGDGGDDTIDAWVPETNAWKIRLGHPVEILSNLFTDREEFVGAGEVSRFNGYAVHGGGVRTFELEIRILETPLPLKYGSTADLRIIVGRRSILKTLLNIEDRDVVRASRAELHSAGNNQAQSLPTPQSATDTLITTSSLSSSSVDSSRGTTQDRNP